MNEKKKIEKNIENHLNYDNSNYDNLTRNWNLFKTMNLAMLFYL